jgi:hypothetical protein
MQNTADFYSDIPGTSSVGAPTGENAVFGENVHQMPHVSSEAIPAAPSIGAAVASKPPKRASKFAPKRVIIYGLLAVFMGAVAWVALDKPKAKKVAPVVEQQVNAQVMAPAAAAATPAPGGLMSTGINPAEKPGGSVMDGAGMPPGGSPPVSPAGPLGSATPPGTPGEVSAMAAAPAAAVPAAPPMATPAISSPAPSMSEPPAALAVANPSAPVASAATDATEALSAEVKSLKARLAAAEARAKRAEEKLIDRPSRAVASRPSTALAARRVAARPVAPRVERQSAEAGTAAKAPDPTPSSYLGEGYARTTAKWSGNLGAAAADGEPPRIIGVTSKAGKAEALISFGGTKRRYTVGDTVPGIGTVNNISLEGGEASVNINGVIYR